MRLEQPWCLPAKQPEQSNKWMNTRDFVPKNKLRLLEDVNSEADKSKANTLPASRRKNEGKTKHFSSTWQVIPVVSCTDCADSNRETAEISRRPFTIKEIGKYKLYCSLRMMEQVNTKPFFYHYIYKVLAFHVYKWKSHLQTTVS